MASFSKTRKYLQASLLLCAALLGLIACGEKRATAQLRIQPIQVTDWGPRETKASTPFNLQANGKSAVWIRVTGHQNKAGTTIVFGDTELEDVAVYPDGLTGAVPAHLYAQPKQIQVYIREGRLGRSQFVGLFNVN